MPLSISAGDFKEGSVMYTLAFIVIAFIIIQSLFFLVKSWKHGKKIGISRETLLNTVTSSALFTLAPALSILVTVLALAGALGMVLPWIRLSVIGNLAYETVAAENALSAMGGSLSQEVTDPGQFSTVSWAMCIGACSPLLFLPLVCRKLQNKIGSAVNKNEKTAALGDVLAAAAFIGIITAFLSRAINGCTTKATTIINEAGEEVTEKLVTESSGALSILTMVCAIVFMTVLLLLCRKVKPLAKLEPFAMPIAMFGAMGCAMLFTKVLPAGFVSFTWYDIGGAL